MESSNIKLLQNRENGTDLFRAVGILLMIIGHVGFGGGAINIFMHFICRCGLSYRDTIANLIYQ